MIAKRLEELPPHLRKEALDFIEFLIQKHAAKPARRALEFRWAGCLSPLRDRYTSVDLQHESLDWR